MTPNEDQRRNFHLDVESYLQETHGLSTSDFEADSINESYEDGESAQYCAESLAFDMGYTSKAA